MKLQFDRARPFILLAALACGSGSLVESHAARAVTLAEIDSLRLASKADSALVLIDLAIPEAAASRDSSLLLGLEVRRGELLTSVGLARQGEDALRSAMTLAETLGDSARICVALRWLGVAVESQGRPEEAAALYGSLLAMAKRRGDLVNEGWARVGLAWSAAQAGRGMDAVDDYRTAVALFRNSGERRGEAWALNGLGIAFSGLGSYGEARDQCRAARRLAHEIGYTMVHCLASNNLGTLEYSLGDPAAASAYFREALVLNQDLGNLRESIIPGINLALCDAELGRLGESADTLETMLRRCRREGYRDLSARVLNQLARTRALQKREGEARAHYRSVLAMGAEAPMKNRVDAAAGLAGLLDAGDSSAAAAALLEGVKRTLPDRSDPRWKIQIEAAAGECLLHEKEVGAALEHFRRADRIARSVGVDYFRDRVLIGASRAWTALGRQDSALAALDEASRVWESYRGRSSDPEWREARGSRGRALCTERIRLDLAATGGHPQYAYERAQAFKARTLLERMAGPSSRVEISAAAMPLKVLQTDLLDAADLLLDFYLGPTCSYLFAITRDSCRVVPLNDEGSIHPLVRLYYDLLRTPPSRPGDEGAIRLAGERLSASLLGGAADLVAQSRRVYVAPDGIVSLMQFDLEPGGEPREWIRVPSAAILGRIRARRDAEADAAPAGGGILALAGVPDSGLRLPGIRHEVRDLARRYRIVEARYLTDRDTMRVSDLASAPSILHIASHAVTDDQRPWLSRLMVGGEGLRADELAHATIPARLAVLSSCQTMHARVTTGEGVLGLSAALLSAGSDCVIATLWPVDDRTTAEFMRHFYKGLSSGRSAAGSIRTAQESIRRNRATAHPFYWAGFVAIGRGEMEIPIEPRLVGDRRLLFAGIAALILLALGGLIRQMRTRRFVTRGRGERLMG